MLDLSDIKASVAGVITFTFVNMVTGRTLDVAALASIPMRSCIGGPFLNKVMATLCLILTDFARRIAGIAELMLFFLGLQATILTCIPVIHRIGRVLIGKTVRLRFFPAAIQARVVLKFNPKISACAGA